MDDFKLLIASLLIVVISWKVFEWFSWSRSKSYRSSRWQYYKAKISFVLTTFIVAFVVWGFYISEKPVINSVVVKEKNYETMSTGKEENKTSSTLMTNSRTNEANEIQFHPYVRATTDIKDYSDEEIFELEEKAQYHGDDPIVRSRLGLPPKKK